jgi:hypothetical protein
MQEQEPGTPDLQPGCRKHLASRTQMPTVAIALILCVNAGARARHPRSAARLQEASGRQDSDATVTVAIALILCVNSGARARHSRSAARRQEASGRQDSDANGSNMCCRSRQEYIMQVHVSLSCVYHSLARVCLCAEREREHARMHYACECLSCRRALGLPLLE